jgi:hypothetical protein
MSPIVARRRLGLALLVVVVCGLALNGARADASGNAGVRPSLVALLNDSLRADYVRSGPNDPMYFSRGRWLSEDDAYWPAMTSPATAAAVLYRHTHARWLAHVAISTINHAIVRYQRSNGSFSGTSSSDIATMLFSSQLARAYLALGVALPDRTRARWRAVLRDGATYLIRNGNLSWYTNGNIVLGNAEVMALTFQVTGDPRFRAAYEHAFNFAVDPAGARWKGFGLHLTRAPTRVDGSDGAGYLTERADGGTPGFDPEYTELQLDIASRLYLLTRDAKALRLAHESRSRHVAP